MKAIQLIKFLGESINNPSFLEFLESNNFDTDWSQISCKS